MRRGYRETLIWGALVLLMMTISLAAQDVDRRIESTFKSSYVFKTYLQGDNIQIHSQDGVVTLTGTV
ncbi:MAG: BON domain-containing protein, partial [Candidatus Aminicenantales bacterium]